MILKKYKPITKSLRHRQSVDYSLLSSSSPQKSLLKAIKKSPGRNNQGKITVRHRASKRKVLYRKIDFIRQFKNLEGTVSTIEYDPYRSSFISLVIYKNGTKSYILTPENLKIGSKIFSGNEVDIKVGNVLPLKNIPDGSFVHNVELNISKGFQIARSAGTYAVVMGKSSPYVTLRLPSGEMRLFHESCKATIGQVSNLNHRNKIKGKAGSNFHVGRRPTVRGSVMNACDHPHGGGEGRAPVGKSSPRTPWGKPTLGYKTRNIKKISSKFIIEKKNRRK